MECQWVTLHSGSGSGSSDDDKQVARGFQVGKVSSGRGQGRRDTASILCRRDTPVSAAWGATALRSEMVAAEEVVPADAEFRAIVDTATQIFRWGIYQTPTRPSWVSREGAGRVVLLGDAAHAMAPFLGAGANMAMSD